MPTGSKKVGDIIRNVAILLYACIIEMYTAEELWMYIPLVDDWALSAMLETLTKCLKNRISKYSLLLYILLLTNMGYSMKKTYSKHRVKLGETGQGLIDNGQEDEFTPESNLANI